MRSRALIREDKLAIAMTLATLLYVLGFFWIIFHEGGRRAFWYHYRHTAWLSLTWVMVIYVYRRHHLPGVVDIYEQLNGWVNHEVGNTAVRMGMDLQRIAEQGAALGEEGGKALAELERELKTMSASADAILRLTRARMLGLGVGDRKFAVAEVNLSGAIDEAIERLEPPALAKGIRLSSDVMPAQISCDETMIVIMTTNLIENAIKYTPRPDKDDCYNVVHVTCVARDGLVHLCVADSGPGIPAEMRERVFLPGQRLSETESERGNRPRPRPRPRDRPPAQGADFDWR